MIDIHPVDALWEVMSDYFQECQALRQSDFTVWPPDPVPASDHASLW